MKVYPPKFSFVPACIMVFCVKRKIVPSFFRFFPSCIKKVFCCRRWLDCRCESRRDSEKGSARQEWKRHCVGRSRHVNFLGLRTLGVSVLDKLQPKRVIYGWQEVCHGRRDPPPRNVVNAWWIPSYEFVEEQGAKLHRQTNVFVGACLFELFVLLKQFRSTKGKYSDCPPFTWKWPKKW